MKPAVQKAIDDANSGSTISAAAARHGVAISTVRRAMRRQGLPPRPPVPTNKHVPLPTPEPYRFSDGSFL